MNNPKKLISVYKLLLQFEKSIFARHYHYIICIQGANKLVGRLLNKQKNKCKSSDRGLPWYQLSTWSVFEIQKYFLWEQREPCWPKIIRMTHLICHLLISH